MAHRDFVAAKVEAAGEAHTFTLAGETFTVLPVALAGSVLDLAAAPERTTTQKMTAWREFVRAQLINEKEVARFDQLLHDRTKGVTTDDVRAVADWLIEVYTGRPTKRPSSSARGSSTTGRRSSAASSKRAKARS